MSQLSDTVWVRMHVHWAYKVGVMQSQAWSVMECQAMTVMVVLDNTRQSVRSGEAGHIVRLGRHHCTGWTRSQAAWTLVMRMVGARMLMMVGMKVRVGISSITLNTNC